MEIQKIPLGKLNPAKYNPRKDLKPGDPEYEKLKKSMETFGYVEPIIWNKRSGHVVSGHQRLKILQHQGETEIECVVVDLDETQEKALNITLNKVSGDWDLPKLADLISELDDGIFDVGITGFDAAEIEDLFSQVHDKEVEEDKFDLSAALEKAAFVKRGDIWTVGRHRLMCGDALSAEDVAKLTDGRKVNLVVTDLPYGVSYVGGTGLTIKNDNLKGEEFYNFILASFKNMAENMAAGSSIYVFHADTEGLNFRKAFIDAGFHLSGVCIWKKNSLVLGRSPYNWMHEPVLFGFKKGAAHKWYAGRSETTVWEYDKPKRNENHPTEKPLGLLAYPIKNSSQVNGLVLDTFLGSGSTMLACEQTDRICYGMDLDTKYASVALRRYVEFIGSDEGVFVERDGAKIPYADLVKEVEKPVK
ncbi:Adenine-specific methyltransferase [Desulfitobacterium hafniense]|uniref:Methyltransferase n=1 Tax=Desulfitobacterium hafniense TaxID=49338 RepID=A0A098B3K2_DESHA|nr:site-specific DNA-methyltransferase [Desulfitobacterium hafniense]CDX03443.1 Adenine-specific methyltransferase [Desulfitobacterium hafniense]